MEISVKSAQNTYPTRVRTKEWGKNMQPPSDSGIVTRLPVTPALGGALVLLLAVATLAWWFQNAAEDAFVARKHTTTVRIELATLRSDIIEISRGLRGYAISGKDDWLEPYGDALVVWINYPYRVVYVRFIGSHAHYDEIDAQTI